MELKDVYELWNRFDSSDATELEVGIKGDHLRLSRNVGVQAVKPVALAANSGNQVETASVKEPIANEVVNTATEENVTGTPVKAPLVGTFYRSPAPDEAPFVEVGTQVKKGDVIGIIEAMKLMNEVVAPADGEVVSIQAQDGVMVEYDQVLIVLK